MRRQQLPFPTDDAAAGQLPIKLPHKQVFVLVLSVHYSQGKPQRRCTFQTTIEKAGWGTGEAHPPTRYVFY